MERPIILKAHEVRGILEGRQTQLRREIKPGNMGAYEFLTVGFDTNYVAHPDNRLCKFGYAGDRLWAKEKWKPCDCGHAICAGAVWASDFTQPEMETGWISSVQMPYSASRITLEIVNVRVERLQDISEQDAKAQGMPTPRRDPQAPDQITHRNFFEIASPEWDANPWVWVIEFKRVGA